MHTDAGEGMYSSSRGFHLYPNTNGSYGSTQINGSHNSYSGINMESGGRVTIGMYDSGGNGGEYREGNSKWRQYYHTSNDCLGIAGSTTIGKDCLIGGQAGIAGHLKIGDRVQMQAKSGVLKNIDDDSVIMGYPAISYRDYNKSYVHFKNLPKIMNFINKLMKKYNDQ